MLYVREIREAIGLSQREIGQTIALDRRRVSEIERGERGLTEEQESRLLDLLRQHPGRVQALIARIQSRHYSARSKP